MSKLQGSLREPIAAHTSEGAQPMQENDPHHPAAQHSWLLRRVSQSERVTNPSAASIILQRRVEGGERLESGRRSYRRKTMAPEKM